MLHNLELTKGLIYAENVSLTLADKIWKINAHELIEKYSKDVLSKNIHLQNLNLSQPDITKHLDPSTSIAFLILKH